MVKKYKLNKTIFKIPIIISLFSIITFYASCLHESDNISNEKQFFIKGTMEGTYKGKLILKYFDSLGNEKIDTGIIRKNKFFFQGNVPGAINSYLTLLPDSSMTNKYGDIEIFLENEKISLDISKDFNLKRVKGAHTHLNLMALNRLQMPIEKQIDSIHATLRKSDAQNHSNLSSRNKTELATRLSLLQKEKQLLEFKFVESHLTSYLSPYLLAFRFSRREINLDSTLFLFNKLTPKVKKSWYGQQLLKDITGRKLSAVGQFAPDFKKNDLNGRELELSEFKNKNYIILDFTASWCAPCKQINPKLIDFYKSYNEDGLEIISVSWDFDEKSWKKGILEEQTNEWHHVSGLFNPISDGLSSLYSIQGIPTIILIDIDGVIVGRYFGSDSIGDLENHLRNIFDQKKLKPK